MTASVEEDVGVHVGEAVDVRLGVDVGLTKNLLMMRMLLAATMDSLGGTEFKKMESQESSLKGEVDMVDLVGGSMEVVVVVSIMEMLQKEKGNAHGECLIDEVELAVGK